MTSKMGAEKFPISYLDVLVHRSKLEIKEVQGLSFVTALCTEAVLCKWPAYTRTYITAAVLRTAIKETCSMSSGLLTVVLIASLIKSGDLFIQYRS
jgi:hypothetical protein